MADQQRRLILVTASFRDLGRVLRLGYTPVQVSRTSPRGLRTPMARCDPAEPPAWLVFTDAGRDLPEDERRAVYLRHLEEHRDDLVARLVQLGAQHRLCCLCWCSPGVPCHRRWLADWWTAATGDPVPEIGEPRTSAHFPPQPPLPGL